MVSYTTPRGTVRRWNTFSGGQSSTVVSSGELHDTKRHPGTVRRWNTFSGGQSSTVVSSGELHDTKRHCEAVEHLQWRTELHSGE